MEECPAERFIHKSICIDFVQIQLLAEAFFGPGLITAVLERRFYVLFLLYQMNEILSKRFSPDWLNFRKGTTNNRWQILNYFGDFL